MHCTCVLVPCICAHHVIQSSLQYIFEAYSASLEHCTHAFSDLLSSHSYVPLIRSSLDYMCSGFRSEVSLGTCLIPCRLAILLSP